MVKLYEIRRNSYFIGCLGCFGSVIVFNVLLITILLGVINWKWFFIQPLIWLIFIWVAVQNQKERVVVYGEGIGIRDVLGTKFIKYKDIVEHGNEDRGHAMGSMSNVRYLYVIKGKTETIEISRVSYRKEQLKKVKEDVETRSGIKEKKK